MQNKLDASRLIQFYHNNFVEDQTKAFNSFFPNMRKTAVVVDVGGGKGFFALALRDKLDLCPRVLDNDPISIQSCVEAGLDAKLGDALNPEIKGDEDVVCLNLILHHLIGRTGGGNKKPTDFSDQKMDWQRQY